MSGTGKVGSVAVCVPPAVTHEVTASEAKIRVIKVSLRFMLPSPIDCRLPPSLSSPKASRNAACCHIALEHQNNRRPGRKAGRCPPRRQACRCVRRRSQCRHLPCRHSRARIAHQQMEEFFVKQTYCCFTSPTLPPKPMFACRRRDGVVSSALIFPDTLWSGRMSTLPLA